MEKNNFSRRQNEKNNSNKERIVSDGKNRSHVWGLSSPWTSLHADSVSSKRSVRLNVCHLGLSLQRPPCFFLSLVFSFSAKSFHVRNWNTSSRSNNNRSTVNTEELITQYAKITKYKRKWPQILPVRCRILQIIPFQHGYVLQNLAKKTYLGLSSSSVSGVSSFAQMEDPNNNTLRNRSKLITIFHRLWVKENLGIPSCRNRMESIESGGFIISLMIGSHVISKDLMIILIRDQTLICMLRIKEPNKRFSPSWRLLSTDQLHEIISSII